MATISIKRGSNVTIMTPYIDSNSKLSRKLLGDDIITLSFKFDGFTDILIGDYITWQGRRYTVRELPSIEKINLKEYNYSIRFHGKQYELQTMKFLFEGGAEFSYTGKATDFLTLIVANVNRGYSGQYTKNSTCPDTNYKTLTFSNENCLSALQRIAEEFDLEYEFNTAGTMISFVDVVGNATGITLEYHNGLYRIKRSKPGSTNITTRLYAYGSTKNIDSNYGSDRLQLSSPGYIEQNTGTYGIIEGTKVFEDIYPSFTGTVDTTPANNIFKDNQIDFDINTCLIEGVTPKIAFLTGDMAGMEIEIASYNHATHEVTLNPYTDEYGNDWPGSTFNPSVGDEYTIIDIKMPDSYVTAAEDDLLAAAQDHLSDYSNPNAQYDVTPDWHYLKENTISLNIGDTVTINDTELASGGITKRILEITQSLVEQYDISFKIGDNVIRSYVEKVNAANELASRRIVETRNITVINGQREYQRNLALENSLPNDLSDLDPGALADIQDALASAASAQSTADGKIVTFFQDSQPTGGSEGDIWFDTDNSNKVYRHNGSTWEEARDTGITTALTNAATAQSTADGKIVTYYQDSEPEGASVGDLWIDTNDGNKLYRYSGSAWVSATVSGLNRIDQTASDKLAGIAAGANVNAPTIGIKINFSDFTTPASGEAYIHGFNDAGTPADVAGYYYYDGIKVTVQGTVWTQQPGEGYIVRLHSTGGLYFCKKENGSWYYDNNTSWVQFTPIAGDLVIGTIVCDSTDHIESATMFGYPMAINMVSDAAADVTKTTIDGGIITSGRIMLGATESSEGVNSGINGYGITDESVRFWAGHPWETDGSGNNAYNAPFRVYHDGRMFAQQATIEGEITAEAGEIGGFDISGNRLSSQGTGGSLVIDSDDLSISLIESGGNVRGKIHNRDIPTLGELNGGADGNYTGSNAQLHSDISQVVTSDGDTDEKTVYLEKYSTSTNVLDQKDSSGGSGYYVNANSDTDLDENKWYQIILNVTRKAASYSLDSNHTKPFAGTEGDIDYDSIVSIGGNFRLEFTVELYSSAGVLLSSQSTMTSLKSASNLTSTENHKIFDKTINIPTAAVYFKVKYKVYNYAYQQEVKTWYEYTGGSWIPTSPIRSVHNTDINITYGFEVYSLDLNTDYELTELGGDGFLSYWGENKYLLLSDSLSNSDENSAFLQSNGIWTHRGSAYFSGVGEKVNIKDGTTPLSSGKLNVATQGEEYAATFRNDGNSESNKGILIQAGRDSAGPDDNVLIHFQDGDGTYLGAVFFDNTGLKMYSALSGQTTIF